VTRAELAALARAASPASAAAIRRALGGQEGREGAGGGSEVRMVALDAIEPPGAVSARKRATRSAALPLAFVLPVPPDQLNARGHWATRRRDTLAWAARVNAADLAGRLPRRPAVPYERAVLAAELVGVRPMDDENRQARAFKVACDWLKAAHYLADDAPPAVRMLPATQRRRRPGEAAHLLLTLTPL
jgi:hypothetical protein